MHNPFPNPFINQKTTSNKIATGIVILLLIIDVPSIILSLTVVEGIARAIVLSVTMCCLLVLGFLLVLLYTDTILGQPKADIQSDLFPVVEAGMVAVGYGQEGEFEDVAL